MHATPLSRLLRSGGLPVTPGNRRGRGAADGGTAEGDGDG
jgi:hypothetical protein